MKNKVRALLIVLCMMFLCGCGDDPPHQIYMNIGYYVDPDTGVNYLITQQDTITVRYNADGSIMVTDKGEGIEE